MNVQREISCKSADCEFWHLLHLEAQAIRDKTNDADCHKDHIQNAPCRRPRLVARAYTTML